MLPTFRIPIILSRKWPPQTGPRDLRPFRAWRFRASSPAQFHQDVVGNIYYHIRSYLEKRRVGKILLGPREVRLPSSNVYHPDLLFVANSRKGILTPLRVEGAPNLIIEVLSASTARSVNRAKREDFASAGVEELWVVDLKAKSVQVYRLGESADEPVGTYDV